VYVLECRRGGEDSAREVDERSTARADGEDEERVAERGTNSRPNRDCGVECRLQARLKF
jgi:hypothetical protein